MIINITINADVIAVVVGTMMTVMMSKKAEVVNEGGEGDEQSITMTNPLTIFEFIIIVFVVERTKNKTKIVIQKGKKMKKDRSTIAIGLG